MAENTTITAEIPAKVTAELDKLAEVTKRSRSELVAEAVEIYTRFELEIVEGILEGLEDAKAGRVVPHEQVAAEMRAIIDAAYERQAAGTPVDRRASRK